MFKMEKNYLSFEKFVEIPTKIVHNVNITFDKEIILINIFKSFP